MALFHKKPTIDEIVQTIRTMSEEDRAALEAALNGDTEEETPETATGTAAEAETETAAEEVNEEAETGSEAEEAGGAEEAEDAADTSISDDTDTEADTADEEAESDAEGPEADDTAQDTEADEHAGEIIESLTRRVNELEEKVSSITALKDRLDEYEQKLCDRFGFRPSGNTGKDKSIYDMSADELSAHIRMS